MKDGKDLADSIHHAGERLPTAVRDLALRLGVNPAFNRSMVRLRQRGRMKPVGATRWMSFSAGQTIWTGHCAFDWRARTGPFGAIVVRDALRDGQAHLDVTALCFIRLSRADPSSALIRGELMRYLAELAWAPEAILLNTRLRWRVDGPDRLIVGAGEGERAAEVVLDLDSQGRIFGGFAPDRPRSATAPFLPTPWRGRFSDYRQHDNLWLPFAGEVSWEIDGKMEVYWEGKITHWESQLAAAAPMARGSSRR